MLHGTGEMFCQLSICFRNSCQAAIVVAVVAYDTRAAGGVKVHAGGGAALLAVTAAATATATAGVVPEAASVKAVLPCQNVAALTATQVRPVVLVS